MNQEKRLSVLSMVASLGTVTIVSAALLALVYAMTRGPVSEAEQARQTAAIHAVLPEYQATPTIGEPVNITVPGDTRPVTVYPVSLNGTAAGAAVRTYTLDGFSGEIILMAGLDNDGKITGYEILSHAETPGLGAKMGEWFRDDRGHRSVIGLTPSSSGFRVAKDPGGEIDGITAATITSRAFLGALRRASEAYTIYTESL